MIKRNLRPDLRTVHTALKRHREDIGKPTQRHHYINEARLIHFAMTGHTKFVSHIKPATRMLRKLYERVICINRQLISEGVDYQLRKLVCGQIVKNEKGNSST